MKMTMATPAQTSRRPTDTLKQKRALHWPGAAGGGQQHEDDDDPERLQKAARVKSEVTEVAHGSIALKVSRRGMPHLMDRDGDQQRRHEHQRRDQEARELGQLLDRDLAGAGRRPAAFRAAT